VVYSAALDSEVQAVTRERQLKRWSRAKKDALIAGDLKSLEASKQTLLAISRIMKLQCPG